MAKRVVKGAIVGVSDHGGWAVFVTALGDGSLVDRRRVSLVDHGLPSLPHHHDARKLPIEEGVALVKRVAASAEAQATLRLEELSGSLAHEIVGIALRDRPRLPESVAERITDYYASNRADWVMYRTALAQAAEARGWFVSWYDSKKVLVDAARALGRNSIDDLLKSLRDAHGPPWQKDHRQAMAAALAATGGGSDFSGVR